MKDWEIAGLVVVLVLLLGGTFTMAVLESLHEWKMEEQRLELCHPRVCRTEHGHRKECDNESH